MCNILYYKYRVPSDLSLSTYSHFAYDISYSRRHNPLRTIVPVTISGYNGNASLICNRRPPRSIHTPTAVILVLFVSSNVDGNYDINIMIQCI